ncbi:MAG: ABC transporter ATP-binding protein [Bacteroidetes bacterium]|nr:ABC transporter ATP-binding protein [Bacteroidota bacterium]
MSLLEVRNLTVAYAKNVVVNKASFILKKGEISVVLGASGDGKTSLLKAIAGLLPMQSGEVLFEGVPVKDALKKLVPGHDHIKLVNQDFALDTYHTVEENIRMRLLRFDEAYRNERVETLLRLTKLNKYRAVRSTGLSGGQQQRLAIARALADEPELLLLDEPFNQLDFQNKQKIERHIRSYIRKNNISAILVTHNGIEAMEWADRIIFIRNGKIKRVDTPQDFFERPSNKYEAGFFGELNKIKEHDHEIYFRPGIFSLTKTKACHHKLKVEYKNKLTLGWYSEYTFVSNGQPFKVYSQQPISNISEIFIQPILFSD